MFLFRSRGRFSLVSAGGVEGLAFIACNDPLVSTTKLALRILTNLQSHTLPLPLSPHLSRLLPVHTTASAASLHHILTAFPRLCPHIPLVAGGDVVRFAVVFRASNSGGVVGRDEVVRGLAGAVEEVGRRAGVGVVVRLVGAEVSVLCWLVKSVAMLAVLPDYHKHCEYSIDKLSKLNRANDQANSSGTGTGTDSTTANKQVAPAEVTSAS